MLALFWNEVLCGIVDGINRLDKASEKHLEDVAFD
jgi:hypothetical protein